MQTIVTFSGGKDSLASLLWIKENFTQNFSTVFCDTGWESELTYSYIHKIDSLLNLSLITLKSKKYYNFVDLVKQRKRFPSTKARFCTSDLKSIPMIDYILDVVQDHCIIIQGIRKSESNARSLMHQNCRFFKYYFEPYKISKSGKPLFHTYRKKDVFEFCSKYSDDIFRPVFDWSAKEIINYIKSKMIPLNPLYSLGFKRVGCFPCIMSSHSDIKALMRYFPDRLKYLNELELSENSSFFKKDAIPIKYRTGKAINKKNISCSFTTTNDIIQYLALKNLTQSIFPEESSCMSFYGLCE